MTLAKLVQIVVAALEEIKARDVESLDVARMTALFDRMIIASGDSTRHARAIAHNVVEKVKAGGGAVYGVEGEQTGEWILVDLGNVLVHVMQAAVRTHYNLEGLWGEGGQPDGSPGAPGGKAASVPASAASRPLPAGMRQTPTVPASSARKKPAGSGGAA